MDNHYAETVRLLLNAAPDVFASPLFALKGGSAINLFVRDMPRLSVDLDLVYVPWQTPRDGALAAIKAELATISARLTKRGFDVQTSKTREDDDIKLSIRDGRSLVKVEVNPVFRGTVLEVEHRSLVAKTASHFSAELTVPTLAPDELYGGKIVAALDRQHPRDLFDISELYRAGGITGGMVECCVTYLAGHNRPIHEVLYPRPKDIEREYESTFVGMTVESVDLETLVEARSRLMTELPNRLTDNQRRFLFGFCRATPNWGLLQCRHASELPALRWKLQHLEKHRQRNFRASEEQAAKLAKRLFG